MIANVIFYLNFPIPIFTIKPVIGLLTFKSPHKVTPAPKLFIGITIKSISNGIDAAIKKSLS
jgi:hypothetical protein